MAKQRVRIGIVGAGANTRLRHIPNFRGIDGVELVGVVNRTPQSGARVAQEFGIPKVFSDWKALVNDPGVDAVMIGTWPYMHCEVACAALEAGKHVLTEARMAASVAEARQMVAAAKARPDRIAQIVPSPFGLESGPLMKQLLDQDYLGGFREIVVIASDDMFWDYSRPIHWRQEARYSGINVLSLGIMHETAMRWAPAVERVFAQATTFEKTRPDLELGETVPVSVPDSLQIVTQHAGGARGMYHVSGVTLHGPGKQIHLYGERGTIKIEFGEQEKVWVGHHGEKALKLAELPVEQRGGWRVEEEFIGAIRGEEPVRLNDFATGLRYMEFTEAVALSAERGLPLSLPLA